MYNDQEQMIDDQILSKFLDNAVAKAKKRIEEEGRIETEDAIPLMLKSQFNHIAHLETKMVTKDEFNARFSSLETQFLGLKEQFLGLKEQFSALKEQFSALKDQFIGLKDQFIGLKDQLVHMKWLITFGFGFLSVLIALLACLQVYTTFIK